MQPEANKPDQPKKPYKAVVSAKLNALIIDHDGPPKSELSPISDMQLLESSLVTINELYRRAKVGRDESTDYINRLAFHTTQLLHELTENPSPLLRYLIRSSPFWPILFSPKPGFANSLLKRLKQLEIGENCQINVSPQSRWSWDSEARFLAVQIHQFVLKCKTHEQGNKHDTPDVNVIEQVEPQMRELFKAACALPPLSKSNAKQWMDNVGWPFILLKTKGQPEKHPKLRTLGEHREGHTETAKKGSKTSESNIRDGIKKLITQALRNMAKHP